jgi:hypothetical protein
MVMKKNMRNLIVKTALGIAISTCSIVRAEDWAPMQFGLACPVQIFSQDWNVSGMRLNILYGNNANVEGFDLGACFNRVTGDFAGFQLAGVANYVAGGVYGLQVAGIANMTGGGEDMIGAQIGAFNMAGKGDGFQIGLCNICDKLTGVQLGLGSFAGEISGLQVGLLNNADTFAGLQLGFVNYVNDLEGIQIGVINIVRSGPVPFCPALNAGF